MAAALGYALTQSAIVALGIFLALGVGFALPFVLIGLSPALMRALPKPGVWMNYLKQALAFAMYGTAAWLVWVLAQQAGVAEADQRSRERQRLKKTSWTSSLASFIGESPATTKSSGNSASSETGTKSFCGA